MALDAATLALLAKELAAVLADTRIDKIYQPTRDEVLFSMRGRTEGFRLLLSARNGSARVCITSEAYENPAVPPSFCMLLRKHLGGGRLLSVRAQPNDRILFFDFQCTNEMGDLVFNTVAAELMGRYCNLVLLRMPPQGEDESPKIIDALKRVDFEDSDVRQLLPGLKYTLPPQPERLPLLSTDAKKLAANVAAADAAADDALRRMVSGVGPVVVREACFRGLSAEGMQQPGCELSSQKVAALCSAIQEIQADYAAGGVPYMVRGQDGSPTEFSFTELRQYLPQFTLQRYDSFSKLLEGYYAEKDRAERMRQKAKQLRRNVQNLYERSQRKQAARVQDLADSHRSDELRIAGELLMANLHAFKKGDVQVKLHNWYTQSEQTVKLDARLTPSQNAQRYFKEYKKKQTAAIKLQELLEAGEKEAVYLETVLYEIDSAEGEAALGEIRAELKQQGYLKYYKQRDKKQKPADVLRYTSSDGFLILVGRNNIQNEKITLKMSRGKDLWFHVKNAPGSHVVVMSEGRDIPLPTQNEAAMLAVWHSGQKNSAQVAVDYTEVKNIRKTGDLPMGMVLYEKYETAYITPELEVLSRLGVKTEV